jgi:NAD(P)-dependent dehydrogenase (short-subunit alcohol dehydrogenase family)
VTGQLQGQRVLVIGRGGGIAQAVTVAARQAAAAVVVAGLSRDDLEVTYTGDSGITVESVDLRDEDSIVALGERVGSVDHVVSTASARARGRVADLSRDAVLLSIDTKVVGPLMLVKHFAPRINHGGSFVLFSGVTATKVEVGMLAVAVTNGAVEVLTRALALELAPIRVNAVSPGVIDSGAWDALGQEGKATYFAQVSGRNPTERVGTAKDVAEGVLFAMTNTFVTGATMHIDGGQRLT